MNEKYTNSLALDLYTTVGCHLCEDAKSVVEWVQKNVSTPFPPVLLNEIDIADDDILFEKYGTRIPVIAAQVENDTELAAELQWPFTPEDFYYFVQSLLKNTGP